MNETRISQLQRRRVSLFDSDGLPWTAHLSLAWLIWIFFLTGGLAAIPIELYIGIWIRAKTRSMIVLLIYVLLAMACGAAFLPDSVMTPQWADVVGLGVVVLWFAGAYSSSGHPNRKEGPIAVPMAKMAQVRQPSAFLK